MRYAPRDTEYFTFFKDLGIKYNSQRVYDDFVKIFNLTTDEVEKTVLDQITIIAKTYGNDSADVDVWYTVVYAGMVAEQNKAFTKLGKRIKRLGMHQSLLQNYNAGAAASFSKGKPWRELHLLMTNLGF